MSVFRALKQRRHNGGHVSLIYSKQQRRELSATRRANNVAIRFTLQPLVGVTSTRDAQAGTSPDAVI